MAGMTTQTFYTRNPRELVKLMTFLEGLVLSNRTFSVDYPTDITVAVHYEPAPLGASPEIKKH